MTPENQIKLLVAEILDDTDSEKFFLINTIFPKAMKIYELLNSRPHACEADYLVLNDAITELVGVEIDRFNARKQFGCPFASYCPFKEH